MQLFVIAIVYTLLLSVECQNEANYSNTAVNGSCSYGNTYTYTMNVGEQGVSTNSNNDGVKEAVKSVMEGLLQQKMDEMLSRSEDKIQNATKEVAAIQKKNESKINEILDQLEGKIENVTEEVTARVKA